MCLKKALLSFPSPLPAWCGRCTNRCRRRSLIKDAQRFIGGGAKVTRAVVAVPAYFNPVGHFCRLSFPTSPRPVCRWAYGVPRRLAQYVRRGGRCLLQRLCGFRPNVFNAHPVDLGSRVRF